MLTYVSRMVVSGCVAGLLFSSGAALADEVDIGAIFTKAMTDQKVGLAKKTKPVDGRPTVVGEIVVTVIKGEGVETRSKPTEAGDVVVRNRCPETGNEEYVVKAAKMKDRYGDPKGKPDAAGWVEYEPKGVEMRYFVLGEKDGPWSFQAPWGEAMVAKAGDVIVQDPSNPKDTYRVAGASFRCTYNIVKAP